MSNRITIEPTEFINIRSKCTTSGVRVFDNYGQSYDNTWDSIPADNLDVLQQVMNSEDDTIIDMINHVKANKLGAFIGGEYYTWDQIKHLFVSSQ